MKKILITVCLLMATAVAIATPVDEMKNNTIAQYKIMVISDIHLLAPALHDDGQAAVDREREAITATHHWRPHPQWRAREPQAPCGASQAVEAKGCQDTCYSWQSRCALPLLS